MSFGSDFVKRDVIIVAVVIACAVGDAASAAPPKKAANRKQVGAGGESAEVRLVRVPDRGIQPQVAVDSDGNLHLVYLADEPDAANVYYVRRATGSESFSKPLRVNSQPGAAIAIGSIRGAQLTIGKGNRPHVVWNGGAKAQPKINVKYASPLLYTRLADDGAAFEPERNVAREAFLLDGGGSVAADREGNVFVIWHSGDGEENRRVWIARSSDDGATFAPEEPIDANRNGVCGCCGLKAFADREGSVYVLYRAAREKVNRDIMLLTSTDGGKTFRSELAGKWTVAMCPMSSESFLDGSGAVTAAWETDGQVFFSQIDKKSHLLSKPITPPSAPGGRKHPALAANERGETILVWAEGTGWQKGGSLAWQIFDGKGKPTRVRGRAEGIPVWSFPAVYTEADDSFTIVY